MYDASIGRFLQRDPLGYWDSMNLFEYVFNNPINFLDPFGLGYFGKRPLGNWPWIPGASSNPIDDFFNTEISHEHFFYDDGTNIGYGDTGFMTKEDASDYIFQDKYYDDDIMKQAEKNIEDKWKPEDYCLIGHNCQNYAEDLRDEYEKLKAEQEKNTCK
jgi:hypothetical protein